MTSASRGLTTSHWRGGHMGVHHEMTELGIHVLCIFSICVVFHK